MAEQGTLIEKFICLTLWLFVLLLLNRARKPPYKLNIITRYLGVLSICLFCVYSFFDGDYYHYKDLYNDVVRGKIWHFEFVYVWIIENVVTSYTAFRIVVWGSATIILYCAYKRLCERKDLALYIFALCYLPWFAYARASLSMALILLGLSYVVKPIRKSLVLSIILGVTFIFCSWFFHQSALFGIAAAFSSILLMNIKNQKFAIVLVMTVPIMALSMNYAISFFLDVDLDSEFAMVSESARKDYFDSSTNSILKSLGGGIGFIIQNLFSLGSLYLSAVLYYLLIKDGILKKMPASIRVIASYVFVIDLMAFGILISANSFSAFHYRVSFFAMPANAVFLSAIKLRSLRMSFYKVVYSFALIGSVYNMLYSTYRMMVQTL